MVFELMTFQNNENVLLESLNSPYAPYTAEAEEVLEVWKFYAYTSREIPEPGSDLDAVWREIRELRNAFEKVEKRNDMEQMKFL